MPKPKMTPRAVLAGLRVPEHDSQRKAIFAILDSEQQTVLDELAAGTADSNETLRSRACWLAAFMHIKDLLTHAYNEAAQMEVNQPQRKQRAQAQA